MAPIARALIRVFLLYMSLLGTFIVSHGDISDINCLKSISESLEDPYGNLISWNFNSSSSTERDICGFVGVVCWNEVENDVLSLQLSSMGLKGKFPQGIGNCTRLTGLDLSNNNLSGHLPSDIAKSLQFVTFLDLSSNNFSGEIPSGIADCVYLNGLRLDNNQLTGHIPQQLGWLNRIQSFSVANNMLFGPVPNFVTFNITKASYANNTGLCGGPLEPCKELRKIEHEHTFEDGFLVGFVFVTVSAMVFFISYGTTWLYLEWKGNKGREEASYNKLPNVKHPQQTSKKISMLESLVTRMNFEELSKATNSFSQNNIIGIGNMGAMYKATVSNGNWFLATKRILDSQHFENQFISEVMTLGKLRHTNIVKLLGFSSKGKEKLLVYKYEPNGSLYEKLHSMEDNNKTMKWDVRVKIMVGLARGLTWLHHNCHLPTAHLNISSKCILLNHNFEPKISNFTSAIFLNGNNKVRKSETCELDYVKNDVYSFGVVVLELITGKDLSEMKGSRNFDGFLKVSNFDLDKVVDKSLIGQGLNDEIIQFLRIGCECIQPLHDKRPTMLQVYKSVRATGERYSLIDDSETLALLILEMDPWKEEIINRYRNRRAELNFKI